MKRLALVAALAAALPAHADSGRLLLEEPFTDSFGSFAEKANDQVVTSYLSDGSYSVTLIARDYSYVISPGGVPDAKDVSVEVNASQSTNVFDSLYGLACRVQSDGSRYMLAVSNAGLAHIIARIDVKSDGHHVEVLSQGPLPEDGFVGNDQLRADCQGDKLTLYVNGRVMAEARDGALDQPGQVGISMVSAGDFAGLAIGLFDDFVVRELPPADPAVATPSPSNAPAKAVDTARAGADFLPEPPTIPAAQDDTVTGSWVGRAINEGLAAEAVWLNLEQVGFRVKGDAFVHLNGAPGYVKLGDIIGGFDPSGELKADIAVDPKAYDQGVRTRAIAMTLDFYARPSGNKALGNINLDPQGSGGDPDAVGALELEQR